MTTSDGARTPTPRPSVTEPGRTLSLAEQAAAYSQDGEVERVLRQHLPVPLDRSAGVLCLCDMTRSYNGPVGHRLHVATELRAAGLLSAPARVPSDKGSS